ncbi:hypothetical protein EIP91_011804 [Steccherinum ochraceum]|uniref:Uncharacterized protein n=1 Tax=Steccherinum ochraceum TaxID=92696 RepID=A0A4R0RHG8_9APHY|nr:hypothetical protein EIP91_011804 [Steccherinum ochraceum]
MSDRYASKPGRVSRHPSTSQEYSDRHRPSPQPALSGHYAATGHLHASESPGCGAPYARADDVSLAAGCSKEAKEWFRRLSEKEKRGISASGVSVKDSFDQFNNAIFSEPWMKYLLSNTGVVESVRFTWREKPYQCCFKAAPEGLPGFPDSSGRDVFRLMEIRDKYGMVTFQKRSAVLWDIYSISDLDNPFVPGVATGVLNSQLMPPLCRLTHDLDKVNGVYPEVYTTRTGCNYVFVDRVSHSIVYVLLWSIILGKYEMFSSAEAMNKYAENLI